MSPYVIALILGLVEGLTEFIPVSSTGHLILVGHLLGFTGPKAVTFEIAIQLGAILAVVGIYWRRFLGLLVPSMAPGHGMVRFAGLRGLWLLFLTSLPASLVGLALHGYIKEYLFGPRTVAWALGVGAVLILLVELRRTKPRCERLDYISSTLALGVGVFQCLSLWPGFSRSAATIMGGMLLGASRKVAAEYSFIAAVPIMVAATGYDLLKSASAFTPEDAAMLAVGFAVSFVSAWAAVRVFIGLLGRMTLRPFAVYRLLLAPLVLWALAS